MNVTSHLRRIKVGWRAAALAEDVARHHTVESGDGGVAPSGHTYAVMAAEYSFIAAGPGYGWSAPVTTKILVVDGTNVLGTNRGPLYDATTHAPLTLEPATPAQREQWLTDAPDVLAAIAGQVRARRADTRHAGQTPPRLDVNAGRLGRQVHRALTF